MKRKIEFSITALNDLDEIYDYIFLDSFNIATAKNFVLNVINYCEILRDNPELGKELFLMNKKTKYRYIVYKKYMIFYVLKEDTPIIYRVIKSRRDYMSVLFGNKE